MSHGPSQPPRLLSRTWWMLGLLLVTFLLSGTELLQAEAAGAAGQAPPGGNSLRPYWHVFLAYGIAWLILLGWLVSIARRLSRVEERLGDPPSR